jgi:hypothetical protein
MGGLPRTRTKNSFESLERLPLMDQLIETEWLNVVVPAGMAILLVPRF